MKNSANLKAKGKLRILLVNKNGFVKQEQTVNNLVVNKQSGDSVTITWTVTIT